MPCPYESCVVQELEIEPLPVNPPGVPFPHHYAITRRSLAELDADGKIVGDSLWFSPASTPDLLREAEQVLGTLTPDLFNEQNQTGAATSTHSFGCADACDCIKQPNRIRLPYGEEVDLPI
jgi:hypothetical protein